MKPVLPIVLLLMTAALGLSPSDAPASNCRAVVVRQQHYVAPAYYEPVVAAVYAPIPVYVPAYSVGMASQASTAADPDLIAEIRLLRQAVERMAGPGPQALRAEPPHVGLARQNCIACHGAQPKGNKLVMFDAAGVMKDPSPELLGEIIARVSSDDPTMAMPKGGKMPAEDRLRLIAGLTAAPAAAAAPGPAPAPGPAK